MKNKVVIITGASSGIGKSLALEYAQLGANVVVAARSLDKLNELENNILKKNFNVLAVKADVSKEEDCKNLIN